MAEITIPAKYNTPEKRWAFCKRAKRIFIDKIHNVVGRWYKVGLTIEEYNQLPLKVRNRLPYQPQLTKVQWDKASDILETWLETRIDAPLWRFMKECENSPLCDPDIDKEDLVE